LKDLDGELLAGAAAITEAEWCEPRVVADRQGLAVDHAEYRAERAIGHGRVTAVVDLHRRGVEWAFGEADLLAPRLVNLSTGRHITVTARVELLRIGPVPGIEAGRGMRRYDVAASFVRQSESDRGRYAVAVVVTRTRLPRIHDRGNTSAVRRDRAKQLHDEHLERRVGRAVRGIRIPRHRLFERGTNGGIAAILAEARHDAEERVAPLAKRDKVMEALEDDVLFAEMRAVAGVLQPVPGNCFLRVGDARVRDVVQPLINPGLERMQERPHRHVVVIHDWLGRVAERQNSVEALSDRADLRRNCITFHPEVQVPVN